MSTPLSFGRDQQGYNAYAPQPSTDIYNATLTNGNETHITVPKTHAVWVVAFSIQGGADIWVDLSGGTAAVPAGNTLASATATLNPGQRLLTSGTKISMITANTTADVSVEMWPVSYP